VVTVDQVAVQRVNILCFDMVDLVYTPGLPFHMRTDHGKDMMAGIPPEPVVPASEQVQVAVVQKR
jgi:hypothetical protein